MMVKLSDKIFVNPVNLAKNSLRLALPYLTNRSSTKCENWCDGKATPMIFREVLTTVTIAWLDPAIQSLIALEATIRLRAYCYAHALGMSITSL